MDKPAFRKAGDFVYRHARPLDFARWRYHFEGGGRAEVLSILAAYQNGDGGFGHALEPDAWNPYSSPLQTWQATRLLAEVGMEDREHPLIRRILGYLAGGADFNGKFWYSCVPANNDYPHAPWWSWSEASAKEVSYNPTASLAGFALRFAEEGSPLYELALRVAGEAIEHYRANRVKDMHIIRCYVELVSAVEGRPAALLLPLDELKDLLREDVPACIERSPALWETTYCCKPSHFIESGDSAFYPGFEALCKEECAMLLGTQREDGSWDLPWAWGDYPDAFAVSTAWWQGGIIIDNLRFLREFAE